MFIPPYYHSINLSQLQQFLMSSTFFANLVQGSSGATRPPDNQATTLFAGSGGNSTLLANQDPLQFSEQNPFNSFVDSNSTLLNNSGSKPVLYNNQFEPRRATAKNPSRENSDASDEEDAEIFANTEEKREELKNEKRNKEIESKNSVNDVLRVDSPEFKKYIAQLVENGEKNLLKTHLCLTCWQYLSKSQRQGHKRLSHHTVDNYMVTSELQVIEFADVHGKLVDANGKKFKKKDISVALPITYESNLGKSTIQPSNLEQLAMDPLAPYKGAYLIPFNAYERVGAQAGGDERANLPKSKDTGQNVPIVASNEIYLNELRKIVQQRLTLVDQESAVRETMMRNREETLLKKKKLNVVDEMMLGLIQLEKNYGQTKRLVEDILERTIQEGIFKNQQNGVRLNKIQQNKTETDDLMDDLEFRN